VDSRWRSAEALARSTSVDCSFSLRSAEALARSTRRLQFERGFSLRSAEALARSTSVDCSFSLALGGSVGAQHEC